MGFRVAVLEICVVYCVIVVLIARFGGFVFCGLLRIGLVVFDLLVGCVDAGFRVVSWFAMGWWESAFDFLVSCVWCGPLRWCLWF